MANRSVFLDRDGTIVEEVGFLSRVEDMIVFPFAAEALRLTKDAGFLNILVTNQSGIARGFFTEERLVELNQALVTELARQGARVDDIYYCPHYPEAALEQYRQVCECRKPSPGLILQAASRWDIDLAASYVIGDRAADLEAGRRAGCHPILVKTGYGSTTASGLAERTNPEDNSGLLPELICDNLLEAARWVVQQEEPRLRR